MILIKSNRPIWEFYLFFPFGRLFFLRNNKLTPRLHVRTDLVPLNLHFDHKFGGLQKINPTQSLNTVESVFYQSTLVQLSNLYQILDYKLQVSVTTDNTFTNGARLLPFLASIKIRRHVKSHSIPPQPLLLQYLVGKVIVGPEGAILKSFTQREPDNRRKRLPRWTQSVRMLLVIAENSTFNLWDCHRSRDDKFSIIKAKLREHLDSLIDEHGQTRYYAVSEDERVFTTVATTLLPGSCNPMSLPVFPQGDVLLTSWATLPQLSYTQRKRDCIILTAGTCLQLASKNTTLVLASAFRRRPSRVRRTCSTLSGPDVLNALTNSFPALVLSQTVPNLLMVLYCNTMSVPG